MRSALILSLLAVATPVSAVTCLVSTVGVAFGTYNAISGSATDSTGQVTVTCTTAVATTLSFNAQISAGTAGAFLPRTLAFGPHRLNYNLYLDAAHGIIWGNGSAGTSFASFSSSIPIGATATSFTVYARIPSSQGSAAPGAYADLTTVSVNY